MPKTPNVTAWLRQLSDLDAAKRGIGARSPKLAELNLQIEGLREKLPTALLTHYDQRRSRGKPAVAAMRNGICGACHLSLPSGRVADMNRGGDAIQVCENCGVFIYLDVSKSATAEASDAVPAAPPAKSRKRALKK